MTSLNRIPPLGITGSIEIEFEESDHQWFFAETCTFVLRVPTVHTTFKTFQEKFLEACVNHKGFGSV